MDFELRPSRAQVIAEFKSLRASAPPDPAVDGSSSSSVSPSLRIDAFLNECATRWSDRVNGDPSTSPWAFWPNHFRRSTTGVLARIIWADADPMREAWVAMAEHHGLVYYDPQGDNLVRPTRLEPPPAEHADGRGRWWDRWRS
jgi:hypothetical protein